MRVKLNDLGYTTLSIQMPVLGKDKGADDYYPALFPDAASRIASAAEWLNVKGYKRVVLISHSMGSWMSNVYLDQTPATPYAAWVCTGLTGGFRSRMLGIDWPMLNVKIPILDVYGENDLKPNLNAAARRASAIAGNAKSRQVLVDGADHFYDKREAKLVEEIDRWLGQLGHLKPE
jgi:pimeloyl-ACP methyl ester carboxylesterase